MRAGPGAETLALAAVLAVGLFTPASLDAPTAYAASDIITGPASAPSPSLIPNSLSRAGTACTCPSSDPHDGKLTGNRPPQQPPVEARLSEVDELAALSSIQTALSKMDDGTPYVWKRGSGPLQGVVRPTKTFRNAKGTLCRHVVVLLTTGSRTQSAEGVACRLAGGRWELEG